MQSNKENEEVRRKLEEQTSVLLSCFLIAEQILHPAWRCIKCVNCIQLKCTTVAELFPWSMRSWELVWILFLGSRPVSRGLLLLLTGLVGPLVGPEVMIFILKTKIPVIYPVWAFQCQSERSRQKGEIFWKVKYAGTCIPEEIADQHPQLSSNI